MKSSESTKRYWRSLNDLEQTPEFKELMAKEFPAENGQEWTKTSRRRFLQLMGASLALASSTSCRWHEEKLLPLEDRDGRDIPGAPKKFTTILNEAGLATGLMLTSFDGRPIKVEGNPKHPESLGATNARAQAATLALYDPDRSRQIAQYGPAKEHESSINQFKEEVVKRFLGAKATAGDGLAFLSEPSASPSELRMQRAILSAYPKARWVNYTPIARDNEVRGCEMAFGVAARPYLSFENARIIVAIDDDFLNEGPSSVRYSKEVAKHRKPEAEWMSRIYSVESDFSATGGHADHRIPWRSSEIPNFLARLNDVLSGSSVDSSEPGGDFLRAIVDDVNQHRGSVVFVCGSNQPAEVHAHIANLNFKYASENVKYFPAAAVSDGMQSVKELLGEMEAGNIQTLAILGGNPCYDMPADFNFTQALSKVETSIHLSLYRDETSKKCHWHVPQSHQFEHWSDGSTLDGVVSIGQPLIEPLYDSFSSIEFLSLLLGRNETSRQIVEGTQSFSDIDLHEGVVAGTSMSSLPVNAVKSLPPLVAKDHDIELCFKPSHALGDGRYANLGWLQELPDPMTKLTWDNAALISFATAEKLGIKQGSMLKLRTSSGQLDVPAYLMPGHADRSITLALGYGRTDAGHVAGLDDDEVNSVGFNSYLLRGSDSLDITGVEVEVTNAMYPLATTQDHFAIDEIGRKGMEKRLPELVREGSLGDYKKDKNMHKRFADLWDETDSIFVERDTLKNPDHRWGMAIDLSSCDGCGTCTIACQAENNISVVGKEEVMRGREMAWIRMDRYFLGEAENPTAINQPVGCQHCELAPCESVCPVGATVHSSEGLNDMVYNRCIGTRYCSNNCPYKVRRFNFFDYNEDTENPANEVMKMVNNPDVTVRSRGVMEKCSMCVQRIERVRIETRNEARKIGDGENANKIEDGAIQMACEQACPSDAIVFGDLEDKNSRVSKAQANNRSYKLLAELNNKPRVSYLARIRNPHPLLVEHEEEVGTHG